MWAASPRGSCGQVCYCVDVCNPRDPSCNLDTHFPAREGCSSYRFFSYRRSFDLHLDLFLQWAWKHWTYFISLWGQTPKHVLKSDSIWFACSVFSLCMFPLEGRFAGLFLKWRIPTLNLGILTYPLLMIGFYCVIQAVSEPELLPQSPIDVHHCSWPIFYLTYSVLATVSRVSCVFLMSQFQVPFYTIKARWEENATVEHWRLPEKNFLISKKLLP